MSGGLNVIRLGVREPRETRSVEGFELDLPYRQTDTIPPLSGLLWGITLPGRILSGLGPDQAFLVGLLQTHFDQE